MPKTADEVWERVCKRNRRFNDQLESLFSIEKRTLRIADALGVIGLDTLSGNLYSMSLDIHTVRSELQKWEAEESNERYEEAKESTGKVFDALLGADS